MPSSEVSRSNGRALVVGSQRTINPPYSRTSPKSTRNHCGSSEGSLRQLVSSRRSTAHPGSCPGSALDASTADVEGEGISLWHREREAFARDHEAAAAFEIEVEPHGASVSGSSIPGNLELRLSRRHRHPAGERGEVIEGLALQTEPQTAASPR